MNYQIIGSIFTDIIFFEKKKYLTKLLVLAVSISFVSFNSAVSYAQMTMDGSTTTDTTMDDTTAADDMMTETDTTDTATTTADGPTTVVDLVEGTTAEETPVPEPTPEPESSGGGGGGSSQIKCQVSALN